MCARAGVRSFVRSFIHSFIHSLRTCARVLSSHCCSAGSQWCMWFLFRAWGSGTSESLGRGRQNAAPPNPECGHVPTTKRPHTSAHHLPLFHRPSEGGGPLRIAGLHRSAKPVQAPPLSSLLDLELRKPEKLRGYPPGLKTTCCNFLRKKTCRKSLHLARTPQHVKYRKKCENTTSARNSKQPERQANEDDLLEYLPRRDQDKEDREKLVAHPGSNETRRRTRNHAAQTNEQRKSEPKDRDHGEQDEERTSRAQMDQRQHQGKLRQEDPEHEEEPRRGTQLPPEK